MSVWNHWRPVLLNDIRSGQPVVKLLCRLEYLERKWGYILDRLSICINPNPQATGSSQSGFKPHDLSEWAFLTVEVWICHGLLRLVPLKERGEISRWILEAQSTIFSPSSLQIVQLELFEEIIAFDVVALDIIKHVRSIVRAIFLRELCNA